MVGSAFVAAAMRGALIATAIVARHPCEPRATHAFALWQVHGPYRDRILETVAGEEDPER